MARRQRRWGGVGMQVTGSGRREVGRWRCVGVGRRVEYHSQAGGRGQVRPWRKSLECQEGGVHIHTDLVGRFSEDQLVDSGQVAEASRISGQIRSQSPSVVKTLFLRQHRTGVNCPGNPMKRVQSQVSRSPGLGPPPTPGANFQCFLVSLNNCVGAARGGDMVT